jgi:geranylgeranyl pyrophosphate synthase
VRDATCEDVDAVVTWMVASGAKARVEARVALLLNDALRTLEEAPLTSRGKELLAGAVNALGDRER